jgi:predicted amidophosphoribosyltransferase
VGDRAVGERAWGWWSATADLLLGAGCPGCGSAWWGACPACRAHLHAQPTRLTAPTPAPAGFPLTATAGPYDDVHRGLLGAHKEDQALMLTSLLGDRLAASVVELLTARRVPLDEPVILVPVPSATAAVRERGFDATAALARRAVRRLSAERPVRTVGLLAQHRGLADQSGLGAVERSANLRGGLRLRRSGWFPRRWGTAAGVRPDAPALVVVDDLVTTGASLTEAARCLAEAGFEVLGAATVSATVRRLSSY